MFDGFFGGSILETFKDYILECHLYQNERLNLLNSLDFMQTFPVSTLLCGDDYLSKDQNRQIVKEMQNFILKSKRFK